MKGWTTSLLLVCLLPLPALALTFEEAKAKFEATAGSKNLGERIRALNAFNDIRTEQSVRYLADVAKQQKNVARYALQTIGRIGVDPAREVLTDYSQTGDANLQSAAIDGLAQLYPPVDTDVFVAALADGKPIAVQYSAARALGSRGTVKAAKAVIEALGRERLNSGLERNLTRALETLCEEAEGMQQWVLDAIDGKEQLADGSLAAVIRLSPKVVELKRSLGQALLPYLEKESIALRVAACDALSALGKEAPRQAANALLKLLPDVNEDVVLSACLALSKVGLEEQSHGLETLLDMAQDKNLDRRTVALIAMLGSKDARVIELATAELTKGKTPAVRAAALKVLAKAGSVEAIDGLVEGLKKNKRGRLYDEIMTALTKLTNAAPGPEYRHWRKYWDLAKGDFDPERAEPEEGKTVVRKWAKKKPKYYGREVVSERVTFIVDNSGSMSAGGQNGGTSRLQICKQELQGVIGALGKGAYFNVISFDNNFVSWQEQLTKATPATKAAAIKWIQGLKAQGGTNIYDPLEAGLLDRDVDTIYLLSDGAPGSGKFVAKDDILREVRKINAVRQIVIHTISVGSESDLMKELAAANGGEAIVR